MAQAMARQATIFIQRMGVSDVSFCKSLSLHIAEAFGIGVRCTDPLGKGMAQMLFEMPVRVPAMSS